MKVAITGHRPNKLGNDYDLVSPLVKEIKSSIIKILVNECNDLKNLTLISGMALGIDTLFAKIAIEFDYPLHAYIPCMGQEKMWVQKSKDLYNEILQHPLCNVRYISRQNYTPSCMQLRNEWMVNDCNLLIAVWDGTSGGTKNCVDYAKAQGRRIIFIDPKNPKEITEMTPIGGLL